MLGGLPRTAVFYSKEFPHLFSSYIRSRVQSQAKPVLGKTIISGKTSFVLQQYEANDVKLCTIQWWRWHRLCFWSSFLPVFFTPQRPAPIRSTVREARFAVATTCVEKAVTAVWIRIVVGRSNAVIIPVSMVRILVVLLGVLLLALSSALRFSVASWFLSSPAAVVLVVLTTGIAVQAWFSSKASNHAVSLAWQQQPPLPWLHRLCSLRARFTNHSLRSTMRQDNSQGRIPHTQPTQARCEANLVPPVEERRSRSWWTSRLHWRDISYAFCFIMWSSVDFA